MLGTTYSPLIANMFGSNIGYYLDAQLLSVPPTWDPPAQPHLKAPTTLPVSPLDARATAWSTPTQRTLPRAAQDPTAPPKLALTLVFPTTTTSVGCFLIRSLVISSLIHFEFSREPLPQVLRLCLRRVLRHCPLHLPCFQEGQL